MDADVERPMDGFKACPERRYLAPAGSTVVDDSERLTLHKVELRFHPINIQ